MFRKGWRECYPTGLFTESQLVLLNSWLSGMIRDKLNYTCSYFGPGGWYPRI